MILEAQDDNEEAFNGDQVIIVIIMNLPESYHNITKLKQHSLYMDFIF